MKNKLGTYHLHTTWSDGKADVETMVTTAAAQGFATIGFSDHYGLKQDGSEVFGLRKFQVPDYVKAVHAARAAHPEIAVKLAVELDYIAGAEAVSMEFLKQHVPYDYLIGSVHYLKNFCVDNTAAEWQGLPPELVDVMFRDYWTAIRNLAETGLVDIIGHLDLPKKFCFKPSVEPTAEIEAALDAIAKSGACIELNMAGVDKPCAAPYPDDRLLRACLERGIPALISDDAHAPGELGRHFDLGLDTLRRAGYRALCTPARQGRGFVEI